jgi:hypothetical protein
MTVCAAVTQYNEGRHLLNNKNLAFSFTSDDTELPSTYHIPVCLHSNTSLTYTLNIPYIDVSPCPLFTLMFDGGRAV